MNYSTLKKVFAVSVLAVAGVSAASAQDSTATTSSSTATVFGGRGQYRTWSIGLNAGALAPIVPFGSNDYNKWDVNLGYGAFIKKQLAPAFALKADFQRGKLSGDFDLNGGKSPKPPGINSSFETELHYAIALKAVVNVGSLSFLNRSKSVNFLVEAGAGRADFKPNQPANNNGSTEWFFPVGLGADFKLSNAIALNLGYSMNFLDQDNLDGAYVLGTNSKDKWSYASAGLEFSLGNKSKPSLQWTNQLALMYDELKDPTLRQEVEALKNRVNTLEGTVNQLSADADGDGVSDRFDKCPGTPAGTVVDGSGCPIKFPAADSVSAGNAMGNIIQFEFDSSVLRTSSYPTLDRISSDLRANSGSKVTLEGHASAEGTEKYNMNLSRDRANSVKTYLVNSGVDANRVTVKAFGESRPMASNATEEGRSQNRRVEIKK